MAWLGCERIFVSRIRSVKKDGCARLPGHRMNLDRSNRMDRLNAEVLESHWR